MAIFQFAMFVYQRVLLSHRLSSFVLQGATCAKSCEGEKCGFKCHWHPVRGTDLAEGIGDLTMVNHASIIVFEPSTDGEYIIYNLYH